METFKDEDAIRYLHRNCSSITSKFRGTKGDAVCMRDFSFDFLNRDGEPSSILLTLNVHDGEEAAKGFLTVARKIEAAKE